MIKLRLMWSKRIKRRVQTSSSQWIKAVTARKRNINTTGAILEVIKLVKYPSVAAAAPFPVRYATKYFTTQPPITQ